MFAPAFKSNSLTGHLESWIIEKARKTAFFLFFSLIYLRFSVAASNLFPNFASLFCDGSMMENFNETLLFEKRRRKKFPIPNPNPIFQFFETCSLESHGFFNSIKPSFLVVLRMVLQLFELDFIVACFFDKCQDKVFTQENRAFLFKIVLKHNCPK